MMQETRYQKVMKLELSEVSDGYVVYDSDRDRVHFLNPVAAVIFELCDGNHTIDEIRSILISGYDLDSFPDEDFRAAVDSMLAEGLIASCPRSS